MQPRRQLAFGGHDVDRRDARKPGHQFEIGGRQSAGRLGRQVADGDDDVGEPGGGVRLEQAPAERPLVERARGGDT